LQAVAPQTYALHELVLTVWQTPAPLQVRAGEYVEPRQDSPTHVVPDCHLRQAPKPSHWPSSPQLDIASGVQLLLGSVPALTGRQRPSVAPVLAFAQALQVPPQADSQQTPSAQKPVAHAAELLQVAPCCLSGMHAVPSQ
jgi:hypothetical protein